MPVLAPSLVWAFDMIWEHYLYQLTNIGHGNKTTGGNHMPV